MNKLELVEIDRIIDELKIVDNSAKAYQNYMGRGMAKKSTHGIVCKLSPDSFIDYLNEIVDDKSKDKEVKYLIIDFLSNVKSDNLGKNYIYY